MSIPHRTGRGVRPARRTRTPLTRVELRELVVRAPGGLAVDREHGIIRGVKVLGLESANGRRYDPRAIRRAVPLYEGIHVNIDHPPKKEGPEASRSAYDRFGKLVNVRYLEEQGLYADLEYLKTHPMAERICEAAERMPDAFGLSHNAQGEGELKDGVFLVRAIAEVRHVDLVADPATTRSLCEQTMHHQETSATCDRGERDLPPRDYAPGSKPDEENLLDDDKPEAGDHIDDLLAAVAKLAKSDDPSAKEKIRKITALLTCDMDDDDDDGEEDEAETSAAQAHTGEDDGGQNYEGQESRQARRPRKGAVRHLQERVFRADLGAWIREQCAGLDIPCTPHLLETCLALRDRERIGQHLRFLRPHLQGGQLRSQRQALSEGDDNSSIPREKKSRVAWLMN